MISISNIVRCTFSRPLSKIPSIDDQAFCKNASRSKTSGTSLMRNTVLAGHISDGTLWAVTRAGNAVPSHTPSMMPATKAAQLSWFMSRGTLMYWFTTGSLSEIIYSSSLSLLRSSASACRLNKCRHKVVVMNCRRARMRVGRCWEALRGVRGRATDPADGGRWDSLACSTWEVCTIS